jgi:uncharacterized surface protein with fasciclin (FAS1) repeats
MRKFFTLLSVFAVFALMALPVFAQEEATIAELVVASAGSDAPEFTILLAAVQAADPAILELLSNADADLTVFAPTDAAFAAAFEALGVTPEDVLADTKTLTNILKYHVVPASLLAENVIALDGALVGTALYETAVAIAVADGVVKVNEAAVVVPDVLASNGVVHVIDAVLLPPAGDEEMMEMDATEEPEMMEMVSIAETVIAAAGGDPAEFTILLAAVQAADAATDGALVAALINNGPYTVFAPTDAAFAAALEALGLTAEELLGNTDLLIQVLSYHIVPGHFAAKTVVAVAGMSEEGVNVATALPGTTVTVMLNGESVMVNDATVVQTDIHASNGLIHVIDTVLLPPAE